MLKTNRSKTKTRGIIPILSCQAPDTSCRALHILKVFISPVLYGSNGAQHSSTVFLQGAKGAPSMQQKSRPLWHYKLMTR
eukprot:1140769-Pelagomonas_calceolata.AAC.2